jgi:hypothetical protein
MRRADPPFSLDFAGGVGKVHRPDEKLLFDRRSA